MTSPSWRPFLLGCLFMFSIVGALRAGSNEKDKVATARDRLTDAISSSAAIYYCGVQGKCEQKAYIVRRILLETGTQHYLVGSVYREYPNLPVDG